MSKEYVASLYGYTDSGNIVQCKSPIDGKLYGTYASNLREYDRDGTIIQNIITLPCFPDNLLMLNSGTMLIKGKKIIGGITEYHGVWRGVYPYTSFSEVYQFENGSNILSRGWDKSPNDLVLIGEYTVVERSDRPFCLLIRGKNDGVDWDVAKSYNRDPILNIETIRHIHAVNYDPYTQQFFISIGDWANEVRIDTTENGDIVNTYLGGQGEIIGYNNQEIRAVSLAFSQNYIHWGMDGYGEDHKPWFVRCNRATKEIEKITSATGAIYITQKISTPYGDMFVGNDAVEKHAYEANTSSDLFLMHDETEWHQVYSWEGNPAKAGYARIYQLVDNGDGRFYAYLTNILGGDGEALSATAIFDIVEVKEEPPTKIKSECVFVANIGGEIKTATVILTNENGLLKRQKLFINNNGELIY